MAALDPELNVAAHALLAEQARFVVVGGFSVIANRFIRATEDATSYIRSTSIAMPMPPATHIDSMP
jgi:flagellar basal body rod protein FlgC